MTEEEWRTDRWSWGFDQAPRLKSKLEPLWKFDVPQYHVPPRRPGDPGWLSVYIAKSLSGSAHAAPDVAEFLSWFRQDGNLDERQRCAVRSALEEIEWRLRSLGLWRFRIDSGLTIYQLARTMAAAKVHGWHLCLWINRYAWIANPTWPWPTSFEELQQFNLDSVQRRREAGEDLCFIDESFETPPGGGVKRISPQLLP